MNERLLQFIWQFQYFNSNELETGSGEKIQVIFPGLFNHHQGPDFSDAKIRIGNTTWAGNVEIHINSSGWQKHGHHEDNNYRNVILHVVWNDDGGSPDIPLLELGGRVSLLVLQRYEELMNAASFVACESALPGIPALIWLSWKDRLLAERMTRKAEAVKEYLLLTNGHWEEAFWRLLARNFGAHVNMDGFDMIARSLPMRIIGKHRNQIHQVEALLLGQAGLLDQQFEEEYPRLLQREYRFLRRKYGLTPIHVPLLFLRMRPGNFPSVRLAQLAMLLFSHTHLFNSIKQADSLAALRQFFSVTANDYWHYHYVFDKASSFKEKRLGTFMIDSLIINAVCPALFAYGNYYNAASFREKSLSWLQEIAAEETTITRSFRQLGITVRDASDSQALLELKSSYCDQRRCLDCAVGKTILGRNEDLA